MSVLPVEDTYAAVDLGSNSFHLIVAAWEGDRLRVLDRHKEMVRLADGLALDNSLDPAVSCRALECLSRFGQRVGHLPRENVRAVGTNTLRRARTRSDFIRRGEAALGCTIEVISGREEARLIYLGVSHALEDSAERRLVIDIGGGSTELITGQHFQPVHLESLYMGCVQSTQAHFARGRITSKSMERAEIAARQELEPVEHLFHRSNWDTAIGSSGTLLALGGIARGLDLCRTGLSRSALERICERMVAAKQIDALDLPGLSALRRPVIAGGAAIARALFRALDIDHLHLSPGALREGLLYDLLGRTRDADVRDSTISQLMTRYHVDTNQAELVAATSGYLFGALSRSWDLNGPEYARLLGWAASLHEIGLDVAHAGYHKHGGYLVENMDMPGFSASQQELLAFLVRGHRRKLPLEMVPVSGAEARTRLLRLCLCLRLAVLLHRNRLIDALPPIQVTARDQRVDLRFPGGWLDIHPLTLADLEQEAAYQKAADLKLGFA